MPTLGELRQKYPQYNDMSDGQFADAFYNKFYSDMPRADFDQKLGVQQQAPEQPADDLSWSDVPGAALKNLPKSAVQFGKDIVQPFVHPVETGTSMANLGMGVLEKLGGFAGPLGFISQKIGGGQHEKYADAVGKFLMDRYGSADAVKNTLATDPVGVAADVATVLSGGEMATARVPSISGKIGAVARAVDPLTLPIKGLEVAGKGAAHVIGGLTAHTGVDPVKRAFTSGVEGGEAGQAFRDSMREKVDPAAVVTEARQAVGKIAQERGKEYRANKALVDSDKAVLDFDKIDDALADITQVATYKGQVLSPTTQEIRKKLAQTIQRWKKLDPAEFHTVEGMDALKRKLGDIRDATERGTPERRVADQVYNAVKNTISAQAPGYAKVMKGYEEATGLIKEIEKTLSLNPNASVDTALRKLQAIMRDNVNTNFGQRRKLAEFLVEAGAPHLMERLAGQAMSQWTPRGLAKLLGGEILSKVASTGLGAGALAGAGAVGGLKAAAVAGATLPFMSPRLMGEAAHAAGRVYGSVPGRAIGRTSFQAGRASNQLRPREMVRQDAKDALRDKPEERFSKGQIEQLRAVARGGASVDAVMSVQKMLEQNQQRLEDQPRPQSSLYNNVTNWLEARHKKDFGDPSAKGAIGDAMMAINLMPMGRMGRPGPVFAAEKGLGGGTSRMPTFAEIDAELEKALKGTDIHPMDLVSEWGQKNAPAAAKEVWAQREQLEKHVDQLDAKIEKALKPHKIPFIDIALNPARGAKLPAAIKEMLAERARIVGE